MTRLRRLSGYHRNLVRPRHDQPNRCEYRRESSACAATAATYGAVRCLVTRPRRRSTLQRVCRYRGRHTPCHALREGAADPCHRRFHGCRRSAGPPYGLGVKTSASVVWQVRAIGRAFWPMAECHAAMSGGRPRLGRPRPAAMAPGKGWAGRRPPEWLVHRGAQSLARAPWGSPLDPGSTSLPSRRPDAVYAKFMLSTGPGGR